MTDDDLPGDYQTVDGIKKRARALGSPIVAEAIETIEESIERDEDGYYSIDAAEVMTEEYGDAGTFFYIAVLAGCALERDYPGRDEEEDLRADGGEVVVTTVDCSECGHPMTPFNPMAESHICRECLEDIQVGDRFQEVEGGDA